MATSMWIPAPRQAARRGRFRAGGSGADLQPVFAPFKEWGFGAVSATGSRATGGTDSTSYNNAGLPGIGFRQDPIEYGSITPHTTFDTYERVICQRSEGSVGGRCVAVWFMRNANQVVPRFHQGDHATAGPGALIQSWWQNAQRGSALCVIMGRSPEPERRRRHVRETGKLATSACICVLVGRGPILTSIATITGSSAEYTAIAATRLVKPVVAAAAA